MISRYEQEMATPVENQDRRNHEFMAYSPMSRPAETWIDPAGPGPIYIELCDLESDDSGWRVQIPAPGRERVGWLRQGKSCAAVVEIGDPGQIRLLSWDPYGQKAVERQRELAEEFDEEALDEVLTLTERFRRVNIEKSGRFPIRPRELFHLGLGPDTGWAALLVCMPQHVELWNEDYRRRWRAKRPYTPPWD